MMEGSLIISAVLFVWLVIVTFLLVRILRVFSKLTSGVSKKDLKVLLEEILGKINHQGELTLDLQKKIEQLKTEGYGHFQKVGIIRYNPFSDTGGNQSFVLSLLDNKNSGFVITSLHSRESTRVFAKPVKEGHEAGYEFSKEEIQAILTAQKQEKKH